MAQNTLTHRGTTTGYQPVGDEVRADARQPRVFSPSVGTQLRQPFTSPEPLGGAAPSSQAERQERRSSRGRRRPGAGLLALDGPRGASRGSLRRRGVERRGWPAGRRDHERGPRPGRRGGAGPDGHRVRRREGHSRHRRGCCLTHASYGSYWARLLALPGPGRPLTMDLSGRQHTLASPLCCPSCGHSFRGIWTDPYARQYQTCPECGHVWPEAWAGWTSSRAPRCPTHLPEKP